MISQRNTTQSNIANGAEWAGGIDDVTSYAGVSISVYSDVNLEIYVEQALDHTSGSWEKTTTIAYAATDEFSGTITLQYRYFRLRIANNSGGDSTELRACSKFHSGLPIEEPISVEGSLSISPSVPELELAAGNIAARSSLSIFGVGSVHTGGLGVVTSLETPAIPWAPLTTAEALEVVSNHPQDNPAGTGAIEVRIQGINAAGAYAEELVTLNGTTAVAVPGTWLCVNFFEVSLAGTALANEGIIDLQVAGGGAVRMRIQPDAGRASQVLYRAPLGTRVFVRDFTYSAGDYSVVYSIKIWAFDPVRGVKRILFSTETSDSPNPQRFELGRLEVAAGSEIALEMQSNTGGVVPVYASINIETVA